MAESQLDRMAAEMRAIIDGSKARWVHRRLSRGLEIVLQRTDERWRLALARPETWPSNDEIETCRRVFKLPDLVEEQYSTPNHGRLLYVIELFWRELAAEASHEQ